MTIPARAPLASALAENPADWPEELLPLFERAITVEYASSISAAPSVSPRLA